MPLDFSQIVGHKRQISALERFAQNAQSSGVFVFVGPEHIGKATVAKTFAAGLLGVSVDELSRHPDALLVSPDDRRSTTDARAYSVDAIRDVLHRLGQSSMLGRTVAIIDDASFLNVASQNALLKALEEPNASTVIILISHDPAALLSTILSRSVVLNFFGEGVGSRQSDVGEELVSRLTSSSLVERLRAAQEIAKSESKDWDALFYALFQELRQKNSSRRPTADTLSAVLTARDRLAANGNSTIVLTELAVQLGQYE